MQRQTQLSRFFILTLGLGCLLFSLMAHASPGPDATFANPRSTAVRDNFGNALALTSDGTIAVVSAPQEPGAGLNIPAVYLFQFANGSWGATPSVSLCDPGYNGSGCPVNALSYAEFDLFGYAIGVSNISNNQFFMVVGAPGGQEEASLAYGFVYIYQCTSSPLGCNLVTYFYDPNYQIYANPIGDYYGAAVAISADGNTVLVGAARGGDTQGHGVAYVYTVNSGSWSGVTTPSYTFTNPAPSCFTVGSLPPYCDEFGAAVALSGSSGNLTALIGAPQYSSGCSAGTCSEEEVGQAYLFTETGGTWSTMPTVQFPDPANAAGDVFGTAVALSADGTKALIGAPNTSTQSPVILGAYGWAYLYMQSGGSWTNVTGPAFSLSNPQIPDYFTSMGWPLPGYSGGIGGGFGSALALSSDGTTLIVGLSAGFEGPNTEGYGGAGEADVYTCTYAPSPNCGQLDPDGYPPCPNMGGTTCYIDQGFLIPDQIFADPLQLPQLCGSQCPTSEDIFGTAVAISADGSVKLAGAPDTSSTANDGTTNNGVAYVYGAEATVDVSLLFNPTPPTAANTGTPFTYIFQLENMGSVDATGVILTADFTETLGLTLSNVTLTVSAVISGVQYSCASTTNGTGINFTCTASGQTTLYFTFDGSNGLFSASVGPLLAGATDTVTVNVTASAAGTLGVTGSVQMDQSNTDANISASGNTSISAPGGGGGGGGGGGSSGGGSGFGLLDVLALVGLIWISRRRLIRSK